MPRDPDALDASSASIPSDASLLTLVESGDEPAMAALFERHSKLVFSVAMRVLRDPSAAEDVLQEIFLQIWRSPTSFIAAKGSLAAWLAVVSRNRAIDQLRRKRPTDSVDDIPLASPINVSEIAERNIMLERVRLVLKDLPEEQRSTLEMAFFDGCTHSEIAEMTGSPLGTVKTRIRTALHSIGKALRQ